MGTASRNNVSVTVRDVAREIARRAWRTAAREFRASGVGERVASVDEVDAMFERWWSEQSC